MNKLTAWLTIFALSFALAIATSCTELAKDFSVTAESPKLARPSSQSPMSLGINLAGVADWSSEIPFVDAFKSTKQWMTQCLASELGCSRPWNTNEYDKLDLDENGWVKSLPSLEDPAEYTRVGTLMFRNIDHYPGGKYLVLYDGEGTIEYGFDAHKDPLASQSGRDVIDVTPSNAGIYLAITSTDPQQTGNYIRNVRVIPEQYETSYRQAVFNPEFIDKIRPFTTIRFINWMATSNSEQSEWQNRPTTQSYTYSFYEGGVPLETLVELVNRLKVHPWFNMPHQATDEYIRNFAAMVKDSLDSQLKVYVEYSNEVWNVGFSQSHWVEQQGIAQWPNSASGNVAKRLNWYGKRTAEMCELWKGVFDEQSDRVVCVLASQSANSWTAKQSLDCPLWSEGPCYQHGIDALAIAPYFGGYLGDQDNEQQVQNWTTEQLFEEIESGGVLVDGPAGGAIHQSVEAMKTNYALASQRNLQLFAYEGGQHLVGRPGVENNEQLTNLFIDANRDPKMYAAYLEYLNYWQTSGGTLFMNFCDISRPDKWGSWGALEHVSQESSPKYDALLVFTEKAPDSLRPSHP
ncbi:MAG: cellulose-binding protein [Cyanophyceae cyanobacterium]